jgi:hypothetical protein
LSIPLIFFPSSIMFLIAFFSSHVSKMRIFF